MTSTLRTRASSTRSSARWGRRSSGSAPRLGLEGAVDAAVALLEAGGVPGDVEVEEVGAGGLEVDALAGGVGGEQDAHGVVGGVGVEGALDLFAGFVAMPPWKREDALVGAVGAGEASARSCSLR
jgi:hypothetical protein